jgi:hypothetical protein
MVNFEVCITDLECETHDIVLNRDLKYLHQKERSMD